MRSLCLSACRLSVEAVSGSSLTRILPWHAAHISEGDAQTLDKYPELCCAFTYKFSGQVARGEQVTHAH